MRRSTADFEKRRLSLELSETTLERLKELGARTGASSHTEVIKSALMFYETIVERLADGYQFYAGKDQLTAYPVTFHVDIQPKQVGDDQSVRSADVDNAA